MKPPDHFIKNFNKKIITPEMIASIIYSLNKRAKNWREEHPEKYREAKRIRILSLIEGTTFSDEIMTAYTVLDYYSKKDLLLLKLFKPVGIHIINGIEYLLYRVHNSEFHLPAYIFELTFNKDMPLLKVKELENFETQGEDPEHLVSIEFCNSVVDLINTNDYTIVR